MNLFKALYIVVIGLLIAAFIGFGIDAFYPSPKAPKYPIELEFRDESKTAETRQNQAEFNKQNDEFMKKLATYNQNVSVILIIFSVMILAASIVGLNKLEILGDGLTLGGVFTLFYGIARSMATEEAKFRFIAITIALIIILFLTYWRFLRKKVSAS